MNKKEKRRLLPLNDQISISSLSIDLNNQHPMSGTMTGIQGQPLEATVVSCSKLKDTEWISRQDPYVCVEYGSTKFRTRTCTDGGRNPVFQEKFVIPLIEGLRELNVLVWNSNTITFDDFIGTGKIQLHKVLSQGFDDSAWPLQTKTGRYAGEVKLILHYANANHQKPGSGHAPYVPAALAATPQFPLYSAPPPPSYTQQPHSSAPYLPSTAYPQPAAAYPAASHHPSHSSPYQPPSSYPASSSYPPPSSYPPSSPYPPSSYPPSHAYPPTSAYPPPPYPPHAAAYPPGIYPPPPY